MMHLKLYAKKNFSRLLCCRITLQDLENAIKILKILKDFFLSNSALFRPVVSSALILCSKVILKTLFVLLIVLAIAVKLISLLLPI